VNKAIDMCFDKGLINAKIDVWLNGVVIPYQYLNAILMTFKLIYQHQATPGITGLMQAISSHYNQFGTSMSAYHYQNL
jgi:hypothetical protein